jgi:hypothetical protein
MDLERFLNTERFTDSKELLEEGDRVRLGSVVGGDVFE